MKRKAACAHPRRERARAGTVLRGVRVQKDHPVEQHVQEEPHPDQRRHRVDAVRSRAQLQRLGQQVEERDADDRTRGKPQDQMQLVLPLEREQATQQRREDGRDA